MGKRWSISRYELLDLAIEAGPNLPSMTDQMEEYLRSRLIEEGFDLKKAIARFDNPMTGHMEFYQSE